MSLILDEYEWTERMMSEHNLGKEPVVTVNRVSRYLYDKKYGKREIRKRLEEFMTQCDPNVSLVKWSDVLDRAVKNAGKFPLVRIDGIDITDVELSKIAKISGRQERRLAFTLLCVAKYWDKVSESNNHWVNTQDKDIMKMANINTSVKRQSLMLNSLHTGGYISFSKKIDNLNIRVTFMSHGRTVMHIQDFRNLGYQYLKYCGEPYFECVNCGITVKIQNPGSGRPQKYCQSCATEVMIRQQVNAVMKKRISLKN